MGAWGKEPFENDDALDFVDSFGRDGHPTWGDVREEFVSALKSNTYLEAPDGSQAIAGAVLVASALCESSFLPAKYKPLLSRMGQVPVDLIPMALLVIARVRGDKSELNELWSEGGENSEYSGWLQTLTDIESVLKRCEP